MFESVEELDECLLSGGLIEFNLTEYDNAVVLLNSFALAGDGLLLESLGHELLLLVIGAEVVTFVHLEYERLPGMQRRQSQVVYVENLIVVNPTTHQHTVLREERFHIHLLQI